jgi:hypothetical protein
VTPPAAAALMHVVKLSTYQATGTLSATALIAGVALGPLMVLGSWVGRGFLARLPERAFSGPSSAVESATLHIHLQRRCFYAAGAVTIMPLEPQKGRKWTTERESPTMSSSGG